MGGRDTRPGTRAICGGVPGGQGVSAAQRAHGHGGACLSSGGRCGAADGAAVELTNICHLTGSQCVVPRPLCEIVMPCGSISYKIALSKTSLGIRASVRQYSKRQKLYVK